MIMGRLFRRPAVTVLIALVQFHTFVAAVSSPVDCRCGYAVNATSDPDYAVFTEILETDFRHVSSLSGNPCWQPQTYNMTASAAHGAYGKMATPLNVVANPLRVSTGSGSTGKDGRPAGLQLWVNKTIVGGKVPMGEIAARDDSMVYGSFRVGMKVTNVPGTCSGFFWYHNDTEEIDMEFLSSQLNPSSHPIYLVMQTDTSQWTDESGASAPMYAVLPLPFDPAQEFHEYRFDWTANKVSFYADGSWIQDMEWTYPYIPGHLTLNHWSNGNMGWSKGPPSSDAVTIVSYVKAYYNSSDETKQALYDTRCPNQIDKTKICQIPDHLSWTIDDETASFISPDVCGRKITTASVTTQSTRTQTPSYSKIVTTRTANQSPSSSPTKHGSIKSTASPTASPALSALVMMLIWLAELAFHLYLVIRRS